MPAEFQEWRLQPLGEISEKFLAKGIMNFAQASIWVRTLQYRRNKDKENLLTIFTDNGGTCSTKHALLKRLAEENHFEGLTLRLGIFRMNVQNTPAVAHTLQRNRLAYLPEAHNYLRFAGKVVDCTMKPEAALDFESDILEEIVISTTQITEYKIAYHQDYLAKWLLANPDIPYTLEELWQVREQCIQDLAA